MMGLINQVCAHTHAHTYTHERFLNSMNCGSFMRSLDELQLLYPRISQIAYNVLMIRETRSFPFHIYLNLKCVSP